MTDTYLSPWHSTHLTAAVRHDAIETGKAVAEAVRRFRGGVPETGDDRPLLLVSSPAILDTKESIRAREERVLVLRMRRWAVVIGATWIAGTIVASMALGVGIVVAASLLMIGAILFLAKAPEEARGIFLPAFGRVDPWTRLPGDLDATDLSVVYAIRGDRIEWIDGDEYERPMRSILLRDVVDVSREGIFLHVLTSDGSLLEIRDPILVDVDMHAVDGDALAAISYAARKDPIPLAA